MTLFDRKFVAALLASSALCGPAAWAGQLTASAFQTYNAANAAAIQAGPFSLYTVPVDSIMPTQLNEGLTEVGKKTAGFNLLLPSQLQSTLLTDIEPVVIGPGGTLYLTDGHHTFTALENSIYGASNPNVFVNVIANYSNLTLTQFFAQMQTANLLFPVDNGVPVTINPATGAPIPASLTGLTSDPYRGLEYSILKNKNSVLFPTSANITGAAGSSIPGLDKMTGFYSDFIEADAYRDAKGGLGLAYLSPGDIALAAQWNLNGANTTTLPGVGALTVAQLPGFILTNSIVNSSVISNATLANGVLDGNGTFTGVSSTTFGTVTVGTPQSGFIMQLGDDLGKTVTLSGANTYTGGTSILAGTLIIANDAALGAAAPASYTIDPNNVAASVRANNGIVFNSLAEGVGTLVIGTVAGGGVSTFTTNRPIAVSGETAILNLNGYITTLTGSISSFGANATGLGSAVGPSDLTIDDNASNNGVLILNTPSPNFYGNLIIGSTNKPTVRVFSDAALGNVTGPSYEIGQVVLNGGTFQAGASFSSVRGFSVTSSSTFDTYGFTTSFAGALTDAQRNLVITNSATGMGAVSFGSFQVASVLELTVTKGTNGTGTTVTFANGIARNGTAQLLLHPSSGALGSVEKVLAGTAPTLTNGIVAPWLVIDSASANNPYDFATYNSNGYAAYAAYTTSAPTTGTGTSVFKLSGTTTLTTASTNYAAYALNLQKSGIITLGASDTLTLGDGSNPAGLILSGGSASITGGTLAFGGSEGVVTMTGSSSIASVISGTGGLTLGGTGTLTLSGASTETGLITVNSGALSLTAANVFAASTQGLQLQDTKNLALATLTLSASNQFAALNSAGNNSTITISGAGTKLTIGDANNLNSTIFSAITASTASVAGVITKNGTGLLDLSGIKSGKLNLNATSTVVVNAGQLRVAAASFANANAIALGSGTELQFAQNGGGIFAGNISGNGLVRLIGGTLQLTGTANSYSGGTYVEAGSTLDLTTANVSSGNANIVNAGGLVVFDQATTGTYSGVISDGTQLSLGGASLSGSFDKDDSSGNNGGNVTLAAVQTYTGATTVEAGTLTLGAVNTIASSSGVDLGRIGGGATATLVLAANNSINSLKSEASNTTSVQLGAFNLTVNQATNTTFFGTITGNGALTKTGAGTLILDGVNNYAGGTTVSSGVLEVGDANNSGASITGPVTVGSGGTLSGHGTINGLITVASGGTLRPGGTIGTVNVASIAFMSGSTYTVETNAAGASDLTAASGTIGINSGASLVVTPDAPATSYARSTSYTILQATGGITGSFGSVTSLSAILSPNVSYSANTVILTLLRTDMTIAGAATTINQQNAAAAITAQGGASALNVALAPQSNAAVQQSLGQLTGDIHTSLRSAALEDSRIIRDTVVDRLGRAADGITAWAAGFGGYGSIATDGNAAGLHHNSAGIIAGADMPLEGGFRLGLAGAYTTNGARVADYSSRASGNSGHVIAYGGWTDGVYDVKLGGDYGWGRAQVTRNVASFAQIDSDHEDQQTGQIFADAGYKITTEQAMVEPYIALANVSAMTGAFAESGGNTALAGTSKSQTQTYSTLGLRASLAETIGGMAIAPRMDIGWQHAFNALTPGQVVTFQSLGQSFTVLGVPLAGDAALVRAGFDLALTPDATLSLSYDGSFSPIVQSNAIRGDFAWKF